MRVLSFLTACVAVAAACAKPATFEDDDSGPVDSGAGDAQKTCPAAQKPCGTSGACADLTKDPNNCGGCGTKCAMGQFCASGKCTNACTAPNTLCGQFCVDLDTDHDNCGKCGMGCAADHQCQGKTCVKVCPNGLTTCDQDCVNLVSDTNNCGSCGNACAQNEICTGGLCCQAGQVACAGQCTTLSSDPDNCGQCGFSCGGTTPYCLSGQCTQITGGKVADVNGNWSPVVFVPCANGQNASCTEPAAEASCTNIGKKLVSHASDGTSGVVSLGASSSCYWSISYYQNFNPQVAGQCLVAVSNAKWTQCCGTAQWHGNTVTVPATLGQQFGYVSTNDTGYNAMMTNTSGTTWGCNSNSSPPTARGGCTTYYVACK